LQKGKKNNENNTTEDETRTGNTTATCVRFFIIFSFSPFVSCRYLFVLFFCLCTLVVFVFLRSTEEDEEEAATTIASTHHSLSPLLT